MKKVLGLILELNPFHNGHLYFINEAIEKVKPDYTIAVISGSFTMRGEVSVVDKFSKAKMLIEKNVDLVMEIPFISAINSADYFAYNSVKILTDLGITDLAFGVELDDYHKLISLKNIIDSELFQSEIKLGLNNGRSYSASALNAIKELTQDKELVDNFSLPNNTLALQYLRAIDKLEKKINITLIKRISNNYFDKEITGKISSATALRELLITNQDISDYTPEFSFKPTYHNPDLIKDKLLFILKYLFSIHPRSYFSNILGVNEGIENRIASNIEKAKTYDDLINRISTRRYSVNTISRLLLHILVNTSKDYQNKFTSYLKMLSVNKKGLEYIKSLPKNIKSEIITSPKNKLDNYSVNIDLKASYLYGLLINNDSFYLEEYLLPITFNEVY